MQEERKEVNRRRHHNATKDNSSFTFWKKILLAIPKNLVYIFVGIVFFAFGAMVYITYTERDLTQFLHYENNKEVTVVDPLFVSLKNSLIKELDKKKPSEV